MGLFDFLRGGRPAYRPAAHQTVEIEFEDHEGEFRLYFVEILETSKKSLTLSAPGSEMSPVPIEPGTTLTVSYFDKAKNMFHSYEGQVKDSRDQEFEVAAPSRQNLVSSEVPARDDLFRIEVNIPVQFQAKRTNHAQMATTHAVTPDNLYLKTNLGIPPETEIRVTLEIPNTNGIEVEARAVGSEKDPEDNRKHISEVLLENITEADRETILSYAVYFQKRQERAQARDGIPQ